jgi:hypothetical protein
MVDVNEVVDLSILVANNFDTIDELTSVISSRVKKNLFNKDEYSLVVDDVNDSKRKIENLVLVNREYFKHILLNIRNLCEAFNKKCIDIKLKRDEKDNISGGRNINSIQLISSDINAYYTLNDINTCDISNIIIETKKIEEVGSIDNLLHNYLTSLCNDIAYLKHCALILCEKIPNDVTGVLGTTEQIMNIITSPTIIENLDNRDMNDENSILGTLANMDNKCHTISIYSKINKGNLMKIVKILRVLELNVKTQEDSLNRYVLSESLL